MRPSHTVWATTLCVVLAASLVSSRPSPEAEAGYSYKPPPQGLRLNYQPPWRNPIAAESRSHASEVTVEQVPIRLVQSRELPPPALSTANHRGAYYFPSANARLQQEQHNQQYYRSEEQMNQERQQQQNRGTYNFPASSQNQQQSYNNNGAQQQQYYRQNEVNQQRGAYPQQSGNNNNYQPQHQRQQFQNQQQYQQQNQQQYQQQNQQHNNQQQNQQQQYQGQQGRSIDSGNNHPQAASGSNPGYQYNPANNVNNNNVNTGYQYPNPSSEAPQVPQEEEVTTETAVTSSTSTELPRITIAISKSTVIHTGKGSYQIDEKTGKPKPIIAEAHSYAGVPEPTKKPETDDALNGEGTGNFPIIAKGTPPEDEEEEEEEDTEANTEQPTTTPVSVEQPNTPQPTAPSHPVSLYSSSWPYHQYGHHAHVVVAPGQTQYFALGTTAPMSQYYAPSATSQFYSALQPTQYIQPATQYVQQPLSYAHQYGAYHPSVFARLNSHAFQKASLKWPFANYFPIVIRDPYVSAYGGGLNQIVEYGPEADICRGKTVAPTAEAPAETPVENPTNNPAHDARVSEQDQDSLQQPSHETHDRSNRMVIYKGGVAIAGPGGTADAGHGGTAIVGPGGTAYSSPNGISVVGPGGKVVLQGANSETILAKGPIIYYHKG